ARLASLSRAGLRQVSDGRARQLCHRGALVGDRPLALPAHRLCHRQIAGRERITRATERVVLPPAIALYQRLSLARRSRSRRSPSRAQSSNACSRTPSLVTRAYQQPNTPSSSVTERAVAQ